MPLSRILLSSFVFALVFVLNTKIVSAASDCSDSPIDATVEGLGVSIASGTSEHTITIKSRYLEDGNYRIGISPQAGDIISPKSYSNYAAKSLGVDTLTLTIGGDALIYSDPQGFAEDTKHAYLYKEGNIINICKAGTYNIVKDPRLTCSAFQIYQYQTFDNNGDGITEQNKCYSSGCLDAKSEIFITGGDFKNREDVVNWGSLTFKCGKEGDAIGFCLNRTLSIINGQLKTYGSDLSVHWGPGTWSYTPQSLFVGKNWEGACQGSIEIRNSCPPDECHTTFRNPKSEDETTVFELCTQISDPTQRTNCQDCASSDASDADGQAGVWTAIGCIKRSPTSIIQRFIRLGLGIGGGVSLIMTLAGGLILTTSQGDPKRTGQAKEMITNAVIGLIFVIFSVMILQFVGFTVLKIPGFGIK
ncbi:MAG: hypothetical protein A2632_01970 [Candidatus Pacebacteria bacterium RIFCSPHIGHO2_01_FULL_46_16]|nr:MAG: hypothetical protein A2632_01970 [Candidatus Pacebacteria bacterium RIFCSPHIGHO2_01_FULL_46_16]OGJ22327.1 MAG: hypothetical protein A3J60_01790 [Candidatus Pacebacteria bacterium RIFCSPHIGHO2_02_FULL_46_9]OGJ37368.1 MAG: hypothetical protein A3A82_02565 [Candidatus Pacebacteria bacterium RIFCSPLOWO2_01_FULL_47_12]